MSQVFEKLPKKGLENQPNANHKSILDLHVPSSSCRGPLGCPQGAKMVPKAQLWHLQKIQRYPKIGGWEASNLEIVVLRFVRACSRAVWVPSANAVQFQKSLPPFSRFSSWGAELSLFLGATNFALPLPPTPQPPHPTLVGLIGTSIRKCSKPWGNCKRIY